MYSLSIYRNEEVLIKRLEEQEAKQNGVPNPTPAEG